MTESTAQPWQLQDGYLRGVAFDNTFIFGVLFIALTCGFTVLFNPELFAPVLFLDLWLLGYHHVIATYTKLAGTAQDRADNRFYIYILPLLVLASVALIHQLAGIWLIVTIYFFWQWYHYTRQSYGISVFYRRKSGITDSTCPPSLDHMAIWAIPIWGLIHRCSQDIDTFLFLPLWMPDLPAWTSLLTGVIAISITATWFITKLLDYSKGRLFYGQFFFMLSHFVTFYIGYIYIDDINNGWLVANIWHNTQYLLFVWLYNQNRFQSPNNPAPAAFISWLSQSGSLRIISYFGVGIIVTSVFYGSINHFIIQISEGDFMQIMTMTVIAYQTLNFHHYIVDSRIWKARKKSNQLIMQLKET